MHDCDAMRYSGLFLLILIGMSWAMGCLSQQHNPDITVTSTGIDNPDTINIGPVDMYTLQFRITNPSNRTFTNIRVRIDVTPGLTYCHPVSKAVEIPVMYPGNKLIEQVSIAEFSNIDCQYTYTYEVLSDP